jgi:hypothetical protein
MNSEELKGLPIRKGLKAKIRAHRELPFYNVINGAKKLVGRAIEKYSIWEISRRGDFEDCSLEMSNLYYSLKLQRYAAIELGRSTESKDLKKRTRGALLMMALDC